LEDRIAIPVVSTVGTVGRVTGVESGVRWYYGGNARQTTDLEQGQQNASDKRITSDEEAARFPDEMEPLPPYGSSKPPSYREEVSPVGTDRQTERPGSQKQSISSQFVVLTSGLGVALSVQSRRTLSYCIQFLARQFDHITTVMNALKMVLSQYDQARDAWHRNQSSSMEKGERAKTPEHDEAARRLADLIESHSKDIWQSLEQVVQSISKFSGAVLPENARHFVKTQLLSLPHRWRLVSDKQDGESETSRGAHRMVEFAKEGLDVIAQVSNTMELTLNSAEQWLQRVGRRKETTQSPATQYDTKDHEMADAPRSHDLEKQ
jgi:transcriptional repressor OPI1